LILREEMRNPFTQAELLVYCLPCLLQLETNHYLLLVKRHYAIYSMLSNQPLGCLGTSNQIHIFTKSVSKVYRVSCITAFTCFATKVLGCYLCWHLKKKLIGNKVKVDWSSAGWHCGTSRCWIKQRNTSCSIFFSVLLYYSIQFAFCLFVINNLFRLSLGGPSTS